MKGIGRRGFGTLPWVGCDALGMRIALVSDVHGNLTALEAVIADIDRRGPDAVVHGGDLVLMGPEPAQVVDRVRELGWPGVVGNTDELLWHPDERERQEQRAPGSAGPARGAKRPVAGAHAGRK
jgi:3',5'-cyclic AMP phosphodiesterase CpdA